MQFRCFIGKHVITETWFSRPEWFEPIFLLGKCSQCSRKIALRRFHISFSEKDGALQDSTGLTLAGHVRNWMEKQRAATEEYFERMERLPKASLEERTVKALEKIARNSSYSNSSVDSGGWYGM